MNEEFKKDPEGKALWQAAKKAWRREPGPDGLEALDPLTLAAYLDGTLSGEERQALEVRLARDPGLLDELAELFALEAVEPPAGVIQRAQALTREAPKAEKARSGGLARLFPGGFLQPLGWGGALAALLVVCLLSFELGRSGVAAEQVELAASAVALPFDLSSDLLL